MASVVTSRAIWFSRSRAWISLLLLTPIAVLAVFSAPHWAIGSWNEFFVECLGWSLFFAGAAMRWWATLYIGGRKWCELICHGPYSLSRNPLYFGTLLMALATAVLIQSFSLAIALVFVSYIYLNVTVPVEESNMRNRYGADFDEYCRRVPRFWPNWQLYHSPDVIEVRVAGLRAELIRALRWVWIPVVCHLLTHLRAHDWWPHWATLP